MKKKLSFFILWIGAIIVLLANASTGFCLIFDNQRLIINATLQQEGKWHAGRSFIGNGDGYDLTNSRTSLKLETTWRAIDCPDYKLEYRVVLKNFYDAALDIDKKYNRSMGLYSTSRAKHDLRYYDTFRDICREAFLNFVTDKYELRIGKQILNWGETGAVRIADIVNPSDLQGLVNQAFLTNFYDVKRGLWMANFLYTPPNAPMNMIFEFILVPDFQPDLLPPWGAYPPIGITPPYDFYKRFDQAAIRSRYSDRPKSWSEPQAGVRMRGYLGGFDWTLFYYYYRISSPIYAGNKGYQNFFWSLLLDKRVENAWSYPFMSTVGFTLNRPLYFKIPLGVSVLDGNIIRVESVMDYHRSFNRTVPGAILPTVANKRLNRYAVAFSWTTKGYIPYITPRNNNNWLQMTLQIIQNWIEDRKPEDEWGVAGTIKQFFGIPPSRRNSTQLTASFSYDFFKARVFPAFAVSHNLTTGGGLYTPMLTITPMNNWKINLSYVNFYKSISKNTDYITFGIERNF
jgi:hypothetical protein